MMNPLATKKILFLHQSKWLDVDFLALGSYIKSLRSLSPVPWFVSRPGDIEVKDSRLRTRHQKKD